MSGVRISPGAPAFPTLLSETYGSSLVARLELVRPMNDALKNAAPALIALVGTVLVVLVGARCSDLLGLERFRQASLGSADRG